MFAGRLLHSIIANAARYHAASVAAFYVLLFTLFFSPVLFTDYLLAPGDGISYFVPSFLSEQALWDVSMWGGYPSIADLQGMFWYPPARLFALLPLPPGLSWNLFVVSAYVLAACFTYSYVYTLTKSRLASFASGLIYGLSGCLVAHLGHVVIIHAAAWFPLTLWSIEKLRGANSVRWFLAGSFSVTCAVLSGHPQIFLYTATVATAYALVAGWTLPAAIRRRQSYYGRCLLLLLFGVGSAAIQLVPTAELARESVRASLEFGEFVAYALPLKQLPTLLFPFLFGGTPDSLYNRAYFGEWGGSFGAWASAELVGHVGLLALMLACIGAVSGGVDCCDIDRRDTKHSDVENSGVAGSDVDNSDIEIHQKFVSRFWLVVSVVALLLALGDATPLARLTYHLPLFNKFRAPARHLLEMTFALSVLAGFGVAAVRHGRITQRFVNCIVAIHVGLVLGCWLLLLWYAAELRNLATQTSTEPLSLAPWSNSTIGVPMLIFAAAIGVLLYWHRSPRSVLRAVLLLFVLGLDLASFGWFYEWRRDAPPAELLQAPASARCYRDILNSSQQRVLPVRGGTGKVTELPPNLSKLWAVPSASGYGPLVLARINRLLGMTPHGSVDDTSWRDPLNQSIDLLAVRYLLLPSSSTRQSPPFVDQDKVKWSTDESGLTLGRECNPSNVESITIDVLTSTPAEVTTIGITGLLACSSAVPDKAEVVRAEVTDTNNTTFEYSLRAGSDLSEWAYDCSDVRPNVQHSRARIFKSFAVERLPARCDGHEYVTKLKLNEPAQLKQIKLWWTGPAAAGAASIKRISLINENAQLSYPLNFTVQLDDPERWRLVDTFNPENSGYQVFHNEGIGSASVYENLRALPRAWLVGETLTVTNEEALLRAVKSSRLPDNRAFDAKQTALVEVPLKFKAEKTLEGATARVVQTGKRDMEVRTSSASAAFLVTSDVYYPGWRATIDGKPVELLRADYVLRGVVVPAGDHVVRFEWQPQSFIYGAAISVVSLIALFVCAWQMNKQVNKHARVKVASITNMPSAKETSGC